MMTLGAASQSPAHRTGVNTATTRPLWENGGREKGGGGNSPPPLGNGGSQGQMEGDKMRNTTGDAWNKASGIPIQDQRKSHSLVGLQYQEGNR